MIATIINDCRDGNAQGRQTTRLSSLIKAPVNFIGVQSELEAAGTLIDVIDSLDDREGVILVNVAPRDRQGKKWPNGTPFGFFHYKNILIVSSIDGLVLSLVKKLRLVEAIEVTDIPEVLPLFYKEGLISERQLALITDSQFRSYDYVPRLAAYLLKGGKVPTKSLSVDEIADAPKAVWFVDNFGNCKTTLLSGEVNDSENGQLKLNCGQLSMASRLKDVANDQLSVVVGSSGIEDKRFLELVRQGGSASGSLNLTVGDSLI